VEAAVHREAVTVEVVSVAAAVVVHTLAVRDPMEAEAAVMAEIDKEAVAVIEEKAVVTAEDLAATVEKVDVQVAEEAAVIVTEAVVEIVTEVAAVTVTVEAEAIATAEAVADRVAVTKALSNVVRVVVAAEAVVADLLRHRVDIAGAIFNDEYRKSLSAFIEHLRTILKLRKSSLICSTYVGTLVVMPGYSYFLSI